MYGAPIRLVVKSRRRLVRDAICGLLAGRPEFSVAGQTGSVDALAELCALRRPDAALVDAVELTVPKLEALRQVRSVAPSTEVVVTYAEVSPQALELAATAGIIGLVPCSQGLDVVLRRVRECARPADRRRPDGVALTAYDVRIAALLSTGRSVRDMAGVLQVSPRTVEGHKRRLYAKLGVGSAGHAVSRAISMGVIGQPVEHPAPHLEDGRPPLAVVHGADGPGVDAVLVALGAAELPAVRPRTAARPDRAEWVEWAEWARRQDGSVVAVLVDPTYDDWLTPAALGVRPVVVLSGNPDLATLVDVLLRGAAALVRVDDVATDLAVVLFAVAHGYFVAAAGYLDDVAGWMTLRLADGSSAVPALTTREQDVLRAIARGHTIRQTAQALGVAAKTVENTRSHLFRKLGVGSRTEAVALAHRLGLLDLDV